MIIRNLVIMKDFTRKLVIIKEIIRMLVIIKEFTICYRIVFN